MTLRDLAPVRALAAERARDVHDAAVRAIKARHFGSYAQSLIDALPPMWVDVDAHLDLLTDLTRPDSRDAVARLVAAKVGIECWATAPAFRFNEAMRMWFLKDAREHSLDVGFASTMEHTQRRDVRVPGISAITDPAEALRLIALAVLSEKA